MLTASIQVVWKTFEPGPTDTGTSIVPTQVLADAEPNPDILFVGGGVTAGIDFGLALMAEMSYEEEAKVVPLAICVGSVDHVELFRGFWYCLPIVSEKK